MTITVDRATDAAGSLAAIRCDFADIADLLDCKHANPDNVEYLSWSLSSLDRGGRSSWYGNIGSKREAIALVSEGWTDGARRAATITPQLAAVVPPPREIRRRVKWDETGSELHLDRALAGDWDKAWRNTGPHVSTPRVVSLGCTFGGNANVTAEQMFWTGAQMIVAADLLENAGYAVEVRGLINWAPRMVSPGDCRTSLVDVRVKMAGQPMRPDAVAAVFAHAGVFRSFGFALGACMPWKWTGSLGKILPLQSKYVATGDLPARAAAAGLIDRIDIVLPDAGNLDHARRNVESALRAIEHNHA
jgi:hypothetical protein